MLATRCRRTLAVVLGGALALVVTAGPAAGATIPDASSQEDCVENKAYLTGEPRALADLGFDRAQEIATGEGVVVAIVDSGMDDFNPHLIGVAVHGVNLVPDGGPENWTEDVEGHGTAIAGIIAAQPVPGSGIRGAAPGARVMPVRVYRDTSDESIAAGWGPDVHRIAEGIRYAADNGAHVINLSLSDSEDTEVLREAVDYATARGALVVASAGNKKTAGEDALDGPRYPAAYPGVLGVAAVDDFLQPSADSFSGPQVDVAAPGKNVYTVAAGGYDCQYASDSASTSFATAYASAAAALQVQRFPDAGPAVWHERIRVSALRDSPDRRDDDIGWGVIRPYEALTIVVAPDLPGADAFEAAPRVVIPPLRPTPQSDTARTAQFARVVLGCGAVLGAVLWIASIARRPRTDPTGRAPS